MNNRRSSFFPPNNGEYISPFTAPAMPNLRSQRSVLHKPVVAEAAFIPRSPLPPQKLAKLANALGISTPLPASSPSPSTPKRSFSTSRAPSEERLSVGSKTATPASATGSSAPSRYLVHVVPPKHFPHESCRDPEAFATFRRGSLVPLQPTLQAQISAIAREYQLPTTHGIILYLIADTETRSPSGSASGKGPRIGEEVWKWLWAKVAEEQPVMRGVGLGLSNGMSSPTSERPMLLRKHSSPAKLNLQRTSETRYPLTPSPSTPSTAMSDTMPVNERQEDSERQLSPVVQSTTSQYLTTSSSLSPETPISPNLDPRLLPGLGSPSFLPVLAKIEFDIDRKTATWYDVWCRSRKNKQRRRGKNVDPQGKFQLRITINDKKGAIIPPSDSSDSSDAEDGEYTRLSDSVDPEDELTAGVSPRHRDPLADVFGSDGEAWSEIQSRRPHGGPKGQLALDGASLSNPQDSDAHDRDGVSDEEVVALWKARNQPQLQRSKVPAPLNLASGGGNLDVAAVATTPSPYSSSDTEVGSRLPYLADKRDDDEALREKRVGVIYDDLELDLGEIDIEEQRANHLKVRDELDKLERNLVQFSPRTLKTVDLSPDIMPPNGIYLRSAPPQHTDFSSAAPQSHHASSQSIQLTSSRLDPRLTRPASQRPDRDDGPIGPPVFKQPTLIGTPSPDADSFRGSLGTKTGSDGNVMYDTADLQAAWPSVPYSILASRAEGDPSLSPTSSLRSLKAAKQTSSPPRVILNGKTSGVGKHAVEKRKNSSVSSLLSNTSVPRETSESRARMRQFEEEAGFYSDQPKLQPSLTRRRMPESNGSPVLPLSPDPFGRFPSSENTNASSSVNAPPARTSSLAKNAPIGPSSRHSQAPSSRFSVDSVAEEQQSLKVNKSPSLVSMKTFRRLWRKSDKTSASGVSIPPSPDPSTLPSRPSSSATSLRETETDTSRTPSPSVPFPSGPTRTSHRLHKSQRDSGLDPFYFDQDSKFAPGKTPSPSAQIPFQFPPNAALQGRVITGGPTSTAEKKWSMRKSLVSKWKNGSEGSSSTDSGSESRRRRPSIADIANLVRNGGNGSISSTSALQSPSVPDLPAEYRMSQHSRMQSRGSVSTMLTSMTSNSNGGDERVYARRKPVAQTSTDSSQESVDPLPTPISVVPPLSFGKGGKNKGSVTVSLASPASGYASEGMRSSFDDSQFEILTPIPPVGRRSPSVSTAQTRTD